MPLILGVDPGSVKTGFGLVNAVGNQVEYIASGVIRLKIEHTIPARLKNIFDSINEVITEYQPDEVAVEQVFMAKNASSALKLGQARGAAIAAAGFHDLPVAEYEARKVKQSVVGSGAADKHQVQHMVVQLLRLNCAPPEDAADALAIAMCHAHTQQLLIKTAKSGRYRRGRLV